MSKINPIQDDGTGKEADGEQLLDSLGVTAINAAQLENSVLAKAAEGLKEASLPADGDKGLPGEAALRENLKAVRREVRAVENALEALDEAAEDTPEGGGVAGEFDAGAGDGNGGDEGARPQQDRSLQRAGLAQRLSDLLAKKQQWKEDLEKLRSEAEEGNSRAGPSRHQALEEVDPFAPTTASGMVETERDKLIRLGVLTPFDRLEGFERKQKDKGEGPSCAGARSAGETSTSGRAVAAPFQKVVGQLKSTVASRPRSKLVHHSELPRREKNVRRMEEAFWHQAASGHSNPIKKRRKQTLKRSAGKGPPLGKNPKRKKRKVESEEEDEGAWSGTGSEHTDDSGVLSFESDSESGSDIGEVDAGGAFDDAELDQYNQRLHTYFHQRKRDAVKLEEGAKEEPFAAEFDGGYKVPGEIFSRLFDYQKTGVKWLWELHTQRAGGIIGDEMGLGKTIQLAAFLAGLHHSGKFKASLIVCPATVLRQWLRELRLWYPPFRVAVLHDSQKSGMLARPSKEQLVREISRDPCGILLTSYEQLRIQKKLLMGVSWGYAILDEGHKIRNPDADVTLVAKQLQTVHRVIMTGSPIQNRLTELWSLFDYVFPGKLGTLPVFQAQFALPIQIGGYSNASAMQVSTAYKCAVVLRDLIAPYLLRRRKADVATQLPKKTEQVLFCSLTPSQRDLYRAYLASNDCAAILQDRKNALAGIDILRKLCNHPDLLQRSNWESKEEYGAVERSGKLIVAMKVLEHWKAGGHKALLFTQTQQMLDIMERCVQSAGMAYHRMDGSTNVAARARLVDDFNDNPGIFVFLLTTKVGGVGINLAAANRVLVFDPDWNPSTDMQARERAWRIGQKKEVTVYRLITSGTIEEKVYHRQIYKQFLTNKVLRDPRQKRFFKAKDMSDLFQLGDQCAHAPETAQIFAGINSEIPLIEAGQATHLTTPSLLPLAEDADALPGGTAGAANAPEEGRNDTQMLRDLFEGTGVMGAMDHSKIESANDPEALSVDAQAAKVAKRAADALRRSRAQVQAAPVNVPTWTGRHGEGGLPSGAPQRRFGSVANPALGTLANGPAPSSGFSGLAAGMASGSAPRSSDLLAHLRQRQQNATAVARRSEDSVLSQEDTFAQGLVKQIVEFLAERGGRVGSSLVADHFSGRVGDSHAALFRQILQSVAKLQRGPGGKEWALKPEFAEVAEVGHS